jgi:tryptophan halogenase
MQPVIRKIVVLGSGSAGLLVAAALKRVHPDLPVVVLRSKNIPIIGVGEGSTLTFTDFLHDFLRVPPAEFFKIANPTWKIGLRFNWGPRGTFYYPFPASADLRVRGVARQIGFYAGSLLNYADPYSALMAHDKAFARAPNGSPVMQDRQFAYHFENESFVEFLEQFAASLGVTTVEDTVVDVHRDESHVTGLMLESGRVESADLFVDCSGFVSLLLGKTLKEPFVSYKPTLFCERAVVGGWDRTDEVIRPYTTCDTMNAGWSWRIDHENRINRGYVFSPDFISDDQAEREFRNKNPKITHTRIIRFLSGRYQRTWVGNVVGVGNSAAFVEPLEATALGAIGMQARLLSEALRESNRMILPTHVRLYNAQVARSNDSIRKFLAVHYKFNTLLDTPFWRQCRENIDLAGAEPIIEYYRESGPTAYFGSLLDPIDFAGMSGYIQMLAGQDVPYTATVKATESEQTILNNVLARHKQIGETGFSVRDMLNLTRDPRWQWAQPK